MKHQQDVLDLIEKFQDETRFKTEKLQQEIKELKSMVTSIITDFNGKGPNDNLRVKVDEIKS